jgi:hypothetical protein
VAQPDELVDFHHLRARRGMSQLEIEDQVRSHRDAEIQVSNPADLHLPTCHSDGNIVLHGLGARMLRCWHPSVDTLGFVCCTGGDGSAAGDRDCGCGLCRLQPPQPRAAADRWAFCTILSIRQCARVTGFVQIRLPATCAASRQQGCFVMCRTSVHVHKGNAASKHPV